MGGGVPYIPDHTAFQQTLASAGNKLVAVDFTATWCGPCQMIGPRFEAMAPEFPFVTFCKVDVDDNQETAANCGIRAMPTFKFYRNNAQVADFTGADEGRLRAILAEHGGPPTTIGAGEEVVCFGLKARPECNGRRGVVRSFDGAKARYAVELKAAADAEGGAAPETLALKRDNLAIACKVGLAPGAGGEALPEALPSGCTEGIISGYLPDTHAYFVKPTLPSGERGADVEVAAACCRLPDGTPAVVVGLQGAPEHNGKPCHVLGVNDESGRYMVALTATQQLKVKRANLRA